MADNKGGLDKSYEGTFSGGQGPVLGLSFDGEAETKGLLNGEFKKLSMEKGSTRDARDGSEEKGFSLSGKGYAGPENWTPTNLGTRNPDDVEGQSKQWLNKGK